ncbi:MAG: ABC transporter ATP-binding protein [Bacilli bacterium]|nr:ABC transporter ATP-binding protein [Bacilli bacterium]
MSENKNVRRGRFTSEKLPKGETKKNLKKILSSMKRYWVGMIIAAILLTGSVVIAIYSPQVTSTLTNVINDNALSRQVPLERVGQLAVLLLILYTSTMVFNFLSSYIMTTIAMRYSQMLRNQINEKINKIPLRYFDNNTIGDILSRLTNDVDMIAQSMQQSLSTMISSFFMLFGTLIAMLFTSWQMALVCIATLPVMGIVLGIILKVAGPKFLKRQALLGEVNGIVEENYNGQLIIKVFNAEDTINQNFSEKNNSLRKTMFQAELLGGLMQPVMNFISYVTYALVCLTGGLLMDANAGVTMGTITAFLLYVNLFQSPLSQIAQATNSMQSAAASGKRVFDFLDEKELEDESDKQKQLSEVKGEVVFDSIHFGYDENREIIHDFSAQVKPGMKVAIVGPTGAGKTTMVNLLMRFYEVNQGNIYIDGVNIKDMSREEVHNLFAMVLQETWVFDGTLRENMIYNTKNVTEEDIKNVIHDAHLTHFVRGLPGGLDYQITGESQISGGQRQLITIARAMLKKAPLLILDEATSNVDTRTEEKIQEAMDRLMKGKTSFVIAHRLSTIKNADLILVMKDGNIIEQGNHQQLMEQEGFYASLYNSQFTLEASQN